MGVGIGVECTKEMNMCHRDGGERRGGGYTDESGRR